MGLKMTIVTEDHTLAALTEAYWAMDQAGNFRHKVSELAQTYGMRPGEVTKTAKRCASLARDDIACKTCGDAYPVASRTEARVRTGSLLILGGTWQCEACRDRPTRARQLE